MKRKRSRQMRGVSFFGDLIYERAVPKNHFLRKLNEIVDWGCLANDMVPYHEIESECGPMPHEPVLLLKMLIVSNLYNLSERQTEELCNDSLSVKCFLGLGADDKAPDHSTLSTFREQLQKGHGLGVYETFLQEIVSLEAIQKLWYHGIRRISEWQHQQTARTGR